MGKYILSISSPFDCTVLNKHRLRWSNNAWILKDTLPRVSVRQTNVRSLNNIHIHRSLATVTNQHLQFPREASLKSPQAKSNNIDNALPNHRLQPPLPHDLPPSPRSPSHIHRHRTPLVSRRVRRTYPNPCPQSNQPLNTTTNQTQTNNSPQASIHASHNPRSASPAWPLAARSTSPGPSTNFAESYDAVTQQGLIGKRSNSNSATLSARIREFATRLLKSKGETQMIAERSGSEEVAPVLKPRKVVYRFSA